MEYVYSNFVVPEADLRRCVGELRATGVKGTGYCKVEGGYLFRAPKEWLPRTWGLWAANENAPEGPWMEIQEVSENNVWCILRTLYLNNYHSSVVPSTFRNAQSAINYVTQKLIPEAATGREYEVKTTEKRGQYDILATINPGTKDEIKIGWEVISTEVMDNA